MCEGFNHLIGKKAYKNHDGLFGKLAGIVQENDSLTGVTPLFLELLDGTRLGAFPSDLILIEEGDDIMSEHFDAKLWGTSITELKAREIGSITDKIRAWSVERNLHDADPNKQALKLGEEAGELFEGLAKSDEALIKDAIGDIYVVLTILSQQLGFTIEECIEVAYGEIKDRRGKLVEGIFVKEDDLKEESEC